MASDVISATLEQLERLRQAGWDDIYPKALFWAKKSYAKYLSRTPSPWKPEDLLHEAIDALFSGRRRLPENVSVLTTIINIMRSMAENLYQRKEHQRVSFEELKGEGKPMDESASLCDDALLIVEGDEIEEKIVALLCEDPALKAGELAERLGIEIKEVYNALKRMRRKLKKHLNGAG